MTLELEKLVTPEELTAYANEEDLLDDEEKAFLISIWEKYVAPLDGYNLQMAKIEIVSILGLLEGAIRRKIRLSQSKKGATA